MRTILDESRSWFFERLLHRPDGSLVVSLVEGIKAVEPCMVNIGSIQEVGPYFQIQVLAKSKCVDIVFPEADAFFSYNESYDVGDDLLQGDEGTLRKLSNSAFHQFLKAGTGLYKLKDEGVDVWFLWTEDRIFYVISSSEPLVRLLEKSPDLSIARTSTWSAT